MIIKKKNLMNLLFKEQIWDDSGELVLDPFEVMNELDKEYREENLKKGIYMEFSPEDKGYIFCSFGCKGLGHPLGSAIIKADLFEEMKSAYEKAGYKIVKAD